MKRTKLILLHGTLQRSTVWSPIIEKLNNKETTTKFFTPDLYKDNPDKISSWLDEQESHISLKDKNILIGYSLGGRFALELYQRNPDKYQGLVLICTDPGLNDDTNRDALLKNDEIWAGRFKSMEWTEMISTWNALPTFGGIHNPISPLENDFDREVLSRIWSLTSKANNPSLWNIIPKINCPLLIVTGSMDTKFNDIGKEIKEKSTTLTRHIEFDNCGHRVPWEDTTRFCNELVKFIEKCFSD